MSIARAGWKDSWTIEQQTNLVTQLKDAGFPCNAEDAKTFTDQMSYLIDQGYPFGMDIAKMAIWRAVASVKAVLFPARITLAKLHVLALRPNFCRSRLPQLEYRCGPESCVVLPV